MFPWVQEQSFKSEDIRRARFEAVCPWSPFEDHWLCARDLKAESPYPPKKRSRNTFEKPVVRNMALAKAAEKVVAEFEYDGDAIRKSVKEFLKELGGLCSSLAVRQWLDLNIGDWAVKSYTDRLENRRRPTKQWNPSEPDSNICYGCAKWY